MITIQDILYVRYGAPDLDTMENFLSDFGLVRAERTARTLYMRGAGEHPYVHVTDLTVEPTAKSIGLLAKDEEDVERLASELGVQAEWNSEPAGGRIVRFQDPSGFDVAVLGGVKRLEPMAAPAGPSGNFGPERQRKGKKVSRPGGPSCVLRLGHALLRSTDMEASVRFYTEVLGFRISDSGYAGDPSNVVGHFLHCGLGKTFTDHHTLGVFRRPESKIDHSGFEVADMEDLLAGGEYLKGRGFAHQWGVGRHVEGSQVFDYWRDPFGNKIEHWTDGDLVNEDYKPGLAPLLPEGPMQWGPPLPQTFYQ